MKPSDKFSAVPHISAGPDAAIRSLQGRCWYH